MNNSKANSVTTADEVHVLLRLAPMVSRKRAEESLEGVAASIEGKRMWNWRRENIEGALSEIASEVTIGCLSSSSSSEFIIPSSSSIQVHPYTLNIDGPLLQEIAADDSSEACVGSTLWQLPCTEFEHIWHSLYFDDSIKNELLSYVISLMDLSERGIDTSIVSVNRLLLLLGPPGTGKTSLCKALAQMSSVVLSSRFSACSMIEVNSHSLFSKWFSESGKLVARLFEQAEEFASDPSTLLFVLIDEAESLCSSRSRSSSSGNDPTDSVRAVNALLTQIDKLRRHSNVFILCTSNLGECLDAAFVDRADVVRVVPLPGVNALASIHKSCLVELIRIGVVADEGGDRIESASLSLAERSLSLSARALRQIPALAYSQSSKKGKLNMDEMVQLMVQAIDKKKIKETGFHI